MSTMGVSLVSEQSGKPILHVEVRVKAVTDNVIVRTDIVSELNNSSLPFG